MAATYVFVGVETDTTCTPRAWPLVRAVRERLELASSHGCTVGDREWAENVMSAGPGELGS
jgi:hypothetical protein